MQPCNQVNTDRKKRLPLLWIAVHFHQSPYDAHVLEWSHRLTSASASEYNTSTLFTQVHHLHAMSWYKKHLLFTAFLLEWLFMCGIAVVVHTELEMPMVFWFLSITSPQKSKSSAHKYQGEMLKKNC